MRAIKVKFYQQTAAFKYPFMGDHQLTYPLPPYSTIIGMIHTLCGWDTTHRFKVSLICNNEQLSKPSVVLDTGWIGGAHAFSLNKDFKDRWQIIVEDGVGGYFGYTRNITKQEILLDRYYTLHIYTDNEEDFEKIYNSFQYPLVFPSLGRWEDLIVINEVKLVDVDNELSVGVLDGASWLPVEDNPILCESCSVWVIKTYYKRIGFSDNFVGRRKFEYKRCYLGGRGTMTSYKIDSDGEQVVLV